MATSKRRPAKIASKRKEGAAIRTCPETGKSMVPVRVVRQNGPTGMFWVVTEDFDGSAKAISRMIPVR